MIETFIGLIFYFVFTIVDCNIEATHGQGEQHQMPKKCKSPMGVIKEWLPVCEDEFKLKGGLQFADLEECEKFYKTYAHHVGFNIRKWSSKMGKEGVHKYKYFVCSKQGFRRA